MSRVESIIFPGANYASTFQGERGYSWRHRDGVCLMNATPMLSSSAEVSSRPEIEVAAIIHVWKNKRFSVKQHGESITSYARFIDIFVGHRCPIIRERRRPRTWTRWIRVSWTRARACVNKTVSFLNILEIFTLAEVLYINKWTRIYFRKYLIEINLVKYNLHLNQIIFHNYFI